MAVSCQEHRLRLLALPRLIARTPLLLAVLASASSSSFSAEVQTSVLLADCCSRRSGDACQRNEDGVVAAPVVEAQAGLSLQQIHVRRIAAHAHHAVVPALLGATGSLGTTMARPPHQALAVALREGASDGGPGSGSSIAVTDSALAEAPKDPFEIRIRQPEDEEVWATKGREFKSRWKLFAFFIVVIITPVLVVLLCCQRDFRCPGSPTLPQQSTQSSVQIPTERRQAAFAESRIMLKKTVFAASLFHFCMGYYTGIIAGAMLFLDHQFGPLDGLTNGAIVSFMLAGAAMGAACAFVADWIGRRPTLLWVACLYLLGALMMCTARDVDMLCMGRAVAGFGVGLSSGLVNMYILEVVPVDARGQLGSWAPILGIIGLVAAYSVSVILGFFPGGWWRVQLGLGILPALFALLLKGWLPESPRWLLSVGRREEARASLKALFPLVSNDIISAELDHLSALIAETTSDRKISRLGLLLKYRTAFLLGIAISVLQQASGISVVMYFGPQLLMLAGFNQLGALVITLAISILQVFTVLANALVIDQVGRRPVALSGTLVIMIGLSLIVSGFFLAGRHSLTPLWPILLMVAGMFLFGAAFAFSLGPLPYVMISELFPQEARAMGCAVTWFSNWTAAFVVCQSFPMLMEYLHGPLQSYALNAALIFAVYLGFTFLALIFIGCLLPERIPKLDVSKEY